MLDRSLIDCRDPAEADRLGAAPLVLPAELQMQDRRILDLLVLEMIGVVEQKREGLVDAIYEQLALHYRNTRILEIKKQEQRRGGAPEIVSTEDLAAEIWVGIPPVDKTPLPRWIEAFVECDRATEIPAADTVELTLDDLVEPNTVRFTSGRGPRATTVARHYPDACTATLVHRLAAEGWHGTLRLPARPEFAARLVEEVGQRLARSTALAQELAGSRTGDEPLARDLAALLRRWMILGRPGEEPPPPLPQLEVLGYMTRQPGFSGPYTTDEWMKILRVGEDPAPEEY